MNVANKVVVVTGASSGIGRALTIELVKKGATVAMADINEEGMLETAKLAGRKNVSYKVLNISDKEAVFQFPEYVLQQHGQIDILINNAGIIQPFIPVMELEQSTIERIMNINFYGTLYMTQAFLPYLHKRPAAHIANISSMGGFIPFPGQTIYGASKAAVKLFTEGLYAELKNSHIGVTIVHPGAINTNIMSNSGLTTAAEEAKQKENSKDKAMPADQAALKIIEAIEKNKYRQMVGKDASMLDILYRFSPRKAVDFITKQMANRKH